jgi:hypothetical protein
VIVLDEELAGADAVELGLTVSTVNVLSELTPVPPAPVCRASAVYLPSASGDDAGIDQVPSG